MKKLVSLLLVVVLALGMTCSVYAYSEDEVCEVSEEEFFKPLTPLTSDEIDELIRSNPSAKSFNEYDKMLENKKEATKSLLSPLLSEAERLEAKKILELDPSERVFEMQSKSDLELQNLGLGEERIAIIRGFQGTEEELRALAATCSILGTSAYNKTGSDRWAKVTMFFSWDYAPFWNYNNAVVAGASGTFLVERVADTRSIINYDAGGAYGSTDFPRTFYSGDMKINPFSGHRIQGFAFPNSEVRYSEDAGMTIVYFAKSGQAVMVFKSDTEDRVGLSYGHAYGKRNYSLSLGIDFSSSGVGGGLGFGLSDETYDIVSDAFDTYTYK